MATMQHNGHILSVRKIHVHYGEVCALSGISFEIACGSALALIGPNGSGKSTLLKTIIGLVKAQRGSIKWCGRDVECNRYEVAYLPQKESVDWGFPLTVRGLVEMGRYPRTGALRRFSSSDDAVVNRALHEMQIENLQQRHISSLSGGQQQRAFIARALAQEPHVLLLDEPLSGLDRPSRQTLKELIRKQVQNGKLIIASHHDIHDAADLFDTVLLLKNRCIAYGPLKEIMTPEKLTELFA